MENKAITIRDRLESLHRDLVGATITKTDTEMIVEILEDLSEKIAGLENHTHFIS